MWTVLPLLLGCSDADLPPPPSAPEATGQDDSGVEQVPGDSDAPGDGGDDSGGDGGTGDSDDTNVSGEGPYDLEGPCEAPEALPVDPLVLADQLKTGEGEEIPTLMGAVDLHVDWDAGRVYVAGQGGLMIFDLGEELVYRGSWQGAPEGYARAALLGSDRVAVASPEGVEVIDAADPEAPERLGLLAVDEPSALAADGDWLYVGTQRGELVTFDLSGEDPVEVHRYEDLRGPNYLALSGDWLYAGDATLGLIPFDRSAPDAPAPRDAVDLASKPFSLEIAGDTLYAAVGPSGLEIFDLADPGAPALLTRLETTGAVQDVAVSEGLMWAVDRDDVFVMDISDPAAPAPLAVEASGGLAVTLDAWGGQAVVGEWGVLGLFALDAAALAPELYPLRCNLYFFEGSPTATLTLENRGGDTLHIAGGEVDDPRFTALLSDLEIPPGGSATLEVSFSEDGAEVDASLCLATDDPDEPVQRFALTSSADGERNPAVGTPAPELALEGIDGETYRLSDQLGRPVVLVYFATW
jgi:hypothetical protein